MKKDLYASLLIVGVLLIGISLLHRTGRFLTESITPGNPSFPTTTPASGRYTEDLQKPVYFIHDAEPEAPIWNRTVPAAFRARIVHPDQALMSLVPCIEDGDTLEIGFFDDADVSSVVKSVTMYPSGTVGMTAQMTGRYRGTLYLAYSGQQLRVYADVMGGDDFYLRYVPELGEHVAVEIDRRNSDYQNECQTCIDEADRLLAAEAVPGSPLADRLLAAASGAVADDTVRIDVMMVYTPAALAYEGSTNGINNNIALAMEMANEAHNNSDTRVVLNLVHAAEVDYTESGSPSTDLYNLRYEGVVYSAMDEVQGWRDDYAADLVCLLESNPGTGGLGFLLSSPDGSPDSAFCLARIQQTDSGYTVVHEWGHNMGCSHSKTQTAQPWEWGDLTSYSAGWQWDDSAAFASIGYCSIMTYEDFDNEGWPYEYDRVPHFSNPDIDYIGDSTNATGNASDGDNARVIRETRYVLNDYRVSPTPVNSFPCSNSFEKAWSPWNYYGAELDWERNSGSTVSDDTGPSSASEGSYYIYVEASGDGSPDQSATLQAQFDFSWLTEASISFAYHMYGLNMGSLALEASVDGGENWTSLWALSGDQGNAWFPVTLSLADYAGEANTLLRFTAVTGTDFLSDMALDNIVVQGVLVDDIDGDGLPNDWETEFFGGVTNAVAFANPDGDPYSNLQEYIAGLNPNIPDSFGPTNFTATASDPWFEWPTASGRLYNVYWSSNLMDGFSLLESNLTDGVFTDRLHSAGQQGFYLLEAELAP